jgi:hypothetical protein
MVLTTQKMPPPDSISEGGILFSEALRTDHGWNGLSGFSGSAIDL